MATPEPEVKSFKIEDLAHRINRFTGSVWGFYSALILIGVWLIVGCFVGFSERWFDWIGNFIGIITFLMVFLLQQSQNKDTLALHLKLNEMLASHEGANNEIINVEEMSLEEIQKLHDKYKQLLEKVSGSADQHAAVSVAVLKEEIKKEEVSEANPPQETALMKLKDRKRKKAQRR